MYQQVLELSRQRIRPFSKPPNDLQVIHFPVPAAAPMGGGDYISHIEQGHGIVKPGEREFEDDAPPYEPAVPNTQNRV
jgi:hypothetical protein